MAEASFKRFGGWWSNLRQNTFGASISEHELKEQVHDRLSMWRVLGGGNVPRVAIVIRLPWTSVALDELGLMVGVKGQLLQVVENVSREEQFLKSLPRERVERAIFHMLMEHVLCLKHEGFREEREWRIIHTPQMWPSKWVEASIEAISGVPQPVYKIPLDPKSELLRDLELPRLFERLIIGPTSFAASMSEAFTSALTAAGVVDAHMKVVRSEIPIRA